MREDGTPRLADKTASRRGALKEAGQVVQQLVHKHVPGSVHDDAALDAVERKYLRVDRFKVDDELVASVFKKTKF